MPEPLYDPCQPCAGSDIDDYHDWLAEIYAARLAADNERFHALCIQGHWNPLTAERIPDHEWDFFYGDVDV